MARTPANEKAPSVLPSNDTDVRMYPDLAFAAAAAAAAAAVGAAKVASPPAIKTPAPMADGLYVPTYKKPTTDNPVLKGGADGNSYDVGCHGSLFAVAVCPLTHPLT